MHAVQYSNCLDENGPEHFISNWLTKYFFFSFHLLFFLHHTWVNSLRLLKGELCLYTHDFRRPSCQWSKCGFEMLCMGLKTNIILFNNNAEGYYQYLYLWVIVFSLVYLVFLLRVVLFFYARHHDIWVGWRSGG